MYFFPLSIELILCLGWIVTCRCTVDIIVARSLVTYSSMIFGWVNRSNKTNDIKLLPRPTHKRLTKATHKPSIRVKSLLAFRWNMQMCGHRYWHSWDLSMVLFRLSCSNILISYFDSIRKWLFSIHIYLMIFMSIKSM